MTCKENGRRIFIGDIQGCLAELEELLEKAAFDPQHDTLHPVGDLVNRGPESLRTLRLLYELGAEPVLGNHDLHLLRTASGTRQLSSRDTLDGILGAPDRETLLAWLGAQPFVRAFDDLLCVHAGLNPAWPDPVEALRGIDPHQPHPASDFVTRVRYCDPNGVRPKRDWPIPQPPFAPWCSFFPLRGKPLGTESLRIVFGHWARQKLVVRPGLRGLDTGCVWGGELTAWIAEEDRLVQVPARRAYCPVD